METTKDPNFCPHNAPKSVETEGTLFWGFDDANKPVWTEPEDLPMPDLSIARKQRYDKIREMNATEMIEAKLRREDEIKEIIALSGLSNKERGANMTKMEIVLHDMRTQLASVVKQATDLSLQLDKLTKIARDYEKSVMYK